MRNIQIVEGANNATYSVFQATEEEFGLFFPDGTDMELVEDLHARLGDVEARRLLELLWTRPILKCQALGVHGTIFFDNEQRRIPASKREIDWDDSSINSAQRELFARAREGRRLYSDADYYGFFMSGLSGLLDDAELSNFSSDGVKLLREAVDQFHAEFSARYPGHWER